LLKVKNLKVIRAVISYQLSVISYQLSVISYQLSVISYQLSVISYQLSVHWENTPLPPQRLDWASPNVRTSEHRARSGLPISHSPIHNL